MQHNPVENRPDDPREGLPRTIWRNSWPILGIMVLNFLVGYVDVYVAGLIGPRIQAAVGFVSQQYFLLIIVGNALGVGTVALVSKAVGRAEWDRVYELTRQTLVLTLALAAVLSSLAYAGAEPIIRFFDLPAPVQHSTLVFLRIYALALIPNYLIILSSAVFRAIGRPLLALKIMALVAVFNMGGDFVLVFGWGPIPPQGFAGIAWSTVLAMTLGVAATFALFRTPGWRPLWRGAWQPTREVLWRIGHISWPAVVLQVAWNAGILALFQFLGRLGDVSVSAMAAYTNGMRLESIIFLPAFALNMAAAVLVGQNLGAGSVARAKRFGWRMAASGAVILSAAGIVLFALAPAVARLLSSDPAVLAETIRYLRVNLLCVPFMVASIVLGGAMQGAGDTRGVMAIIITSVWAIRIPLAIVLCFFLELGALGVWLAMIVSQGIQGSLMIHRFHREAWARVEPRPAAPAAPAKVGAAG